MGRIGLFFDNDVNNFKDYKACPCIFPILIPETPRDQLASQEIMQKYSQKLSVESKMFLQFLAHYHRKPPKIDPKSGVSLDLIFLLTAYIKHQQEPQICLLVFDWDRTQSVVEGLSNVASLADFAELARSVCSDHGYNVDIKEKHIVEFYFGGAERVRALQELFALCQQKKIHIEILTRNRLTSVMKMILNSAGMHVDRVTTTKDSFPWFKTGKHPSKYGVLRHLQKEMCERENCKTGILNPLLYTTSDKKPPAPEIVQELRKTLREKNGR